MAKFEVLKGFRGPNSVTVEGEGEEAVEVVVNSVTRKKGTVVDLSGDELKFAKENDCVKAYKEPKK